MRLLPEHNSTNTPWYEVAMDLIGLWSAKKEHFTYEFYALTCIDTTTNLMKLWIQIELTSQLPTPKWNMAGNCLKKSKSWLRPFFGFNWDFSQIFTATDHIEGVETRLRQEVKIETIFQTNITFFPEPALKAFATWLPQHQTFSRLFQSIFWICLNEVSNLYHNGPINLHSFHKEGPKK